VFRDELLNGYAKAYKGEPMSEMLKPFQHETPSIVSPHREHGDDLDCVGECWLRLSYEIPEMFGEEWVSLDFDRDLKLLKKRP
jgi:hypothetical protein